MRKSILSAGIVMLFLLPSPALHAQILSWSSSFSPSWTDGSTTGTATNISGYSINCTTTATITGGGSFQLALGGSGAQTPTVSGATFTVPGTTNRLQVTPNYTSNANYTNIVLSFSSLATNVSFRIVDIDKGNATSTTYYDQVTVTGSDGTTTYNAILSKYDAVTDPAFLVVSGNNAHVNTTSGQAGNTVSDATDQRGTVNVSFGSASLSSITIRYDNAAGADADPASQAIAIGSVSFTQSSLPVSLTAFTGHRQSQDAVLNWTRRQEINTAYYSLERSTNGNSWDAVGTVPVRGNSSNESNYTYTDINPRGSVLLYRLRIVDQDDHFKYSNIIRLVLTGTTTEMLAYPNPFTSFINVNLNSVISQDAIATIIDGGGKTIRRELRQFYPGNNSFTITDLDRLGKGIYYIEITDVTGTAVLGRSKLLKK